MYSNKAKAKRKNVVFSSRDSKRHMIWSRNLRQYNIRKGEKNNPQIHRTHHDHNGKLDGGIDGGITTPSRGKI